MLCKLLHIHFLQHFQARQPLPGHVVTNNSYIKNMIKEMFTSHIFGAMSQNVGHVVFKTALKHVKNTPITRPRSETLSNTEHHGRPSTSSNFEPSN